MSCTSKYDFCVAAGDSMKFTIRYKAAGVYADISGYTARMQLRTRLTNVAVAAEAVCVVTDSTNGEVTCTLTAEETTALIESPKTRARYVYDVHFINNSGEITTVLEGAISVNIGVTR